MSKKSLLLKKFCNKHTMFVAVNISGTEIEFALIDDKAKIVSKFSISTQNKRTEDQYTTEIKNVFDYLQVNKTEITHAAILSNIPKFDRIVKDFLKAYIKIEPIIISNKDIPLECKKSINLTDVPVDIFAGCYACNKKYGSNVVFVNFDTIVTFSSCVDNEFIGYSVFPGLDLLASVVHEQIAEYPEIIIEATQDSMGTDRYNALNVGVFNGVVGACDCIIQNIIDEYKNKQFRVVATCKKPELLQYSKTINLIDPDLRIKSIIECAKNKMLGI